MEKATQRNAGLDAVYDTGENHGTVFFADDDNTYDRQLFQTIRYTEGVSVFPVGFIAVLKYEMPIVRNGFVADWRSLMISRQFAVDMAGFAISLSSLVEHKPLFRQAAKRGYIEDDFISQIQEDASELNPLLQDDNYIRVWHTSLRPSFDQDELLPKNTKEHPVLAL